MNDKATCTAEHLNHVCIAVRDIDASLALYRELFGIGDVEVVELDDQAVRAALVGIGGSQLEFIQPTDPAGAVARFIERRGEGLHHICFEVDDLPDKLDERALSQLGTLGSGNHFLEVCLDEREVVWVVIHSGSRGVGNKLADRHIKLARAQEQALHLPRSLL